ncbi:MAG: glycosyl transferase family 1 [Geminicoccaceae bacterium]|nr:glycosyl transferase family 1 [Geminicoccaceae bacterium]
MRVTQPAASPRRVLLVADCVGGVWQYSLELAGGLSDGGVEVVLAVAGPPPSAAQRAQAEAIGGLRIAILDVGLDWLADGERELAPLRERLLALAEREEVDLVHLNGAGLGDLPTDRPVIATQHSCLATWWQAMRPDEPLPAAWQWHRARMASGLRAAAAVIAPSAAFAAQIRRAYGADLELEVVRNGRSQHRFRPAACRQAVVITAGRLWDEAKNVRTLDAAAAGVSWPVLAAGPTAGPDGHRVGLENAFALGAIDAAEMRRRLARAGVFVSLAGYEPFGLAVLEAALSGCALVLSDIPTFRELWGEVALFVAPDDPGPARAAINRLIADRGLRATLAERARRRALTYAPEACTQATLEVYRRVLHGAARPHASDGDLLRAAG